ncbi:MAG: DUF2169 domain-containing protein [Nitrospirales bacterium]
MEAGWTLGFEPDGRELLVVVVKGTFGIPENGQEAKLAQKQMPLTEADEFTGEPGFSATLYETDYAHRKPMCDVLLNGSAYAPGGRPAKRVKVVLQVGSMKKSFNVVGDRVWKRKLFWIRPSSPTPFTKMSFSYDCAFGGTDVHSKNPEKVKTYLKNPIGIGYYPLKKRKNLIGKPLPNTEEEGKPVKKRKGKFKPMSFGPIGRNFASRFPLAGTYDQQWFETRVPLWPKDFNWAYFQAAPADQQLPYLVGGEEVRLLNLTMQGNNRFRLPVLKIPVLFISCSGNSKEIFGSIDTIVLEPDQGRFMLTWRVNYPLKRKMFELQKIIAGKFLQEHRRETRQEGKKHFKSLGELVREKKKRGKVMG